MLRCSRPPEPTMDWNLHQLRKSSSDRQLDGICGGLGEGTRLDVARGIRRPLLCRRRGGGGLCADVGIRACRQQAPLPGLIPPLRPPARSMAP